MNEFVLETARSFDAEDVLKEYGSALKNFKYRIKEGRYVSVILIRVETLTELMRIKTIFGHPLVISSRKHEDESYPMITIYDDYLE